MAIGQFSVAARNPGQGSPHEPHCRGSGMRLLSGSRANRKGKATVVEGLTVSTIIRQASEAFMPRLTALFRLRALVVDTQILPEPPATPPFDQALCSSGPVRDEMNARRINCRWATGCSPTICQPRGWKRKRDSDAGSRAPPEWVRTTYPYR